MTEKKSTTGGQGLPLGRLKKCVRFGPHREQNVRVTWGVEWKRARWVSGLSAAWFLEDGDPLAEVDLVIAAIAASELAR